MKILFILGSDIPNSSAAWSRIGFFAQRWGETHKINIIGSFNPKKFNKKGKKLSKNIRIYNLINNVPYLHPIGFLFNFLISFLITTFFLMIKTPEIVIISVPPGDVGLGSIMACNIVRQGCIFDYRDEWESYRYYLSPSKFKKKFYLFISSISRYFYNKCLFITTVTPNIINLLQKRGVKNVLLIPNGADTRTFYPEINKNNDYFILVFMGRIGGYYRLDIVIKALYNLRQEGYTDIKFIIIGEEAEKGALKKIDGLIKKLEIEKYIEYRGKIEDKKRLANLIRGSDIGLIPHDENPLWKNALTAKFYEYCSTGLPIIESNYQDSLIAKIVTKYKIGCIIPPLNVKELERAILYFYKNPSIKKQMGKRGRRLILKKFDREKISQYLLKKIQDNI
jgi:glycosyltransferase involved in cell wall biosynthesis